MNKIRGTYFEPLLFKNFIFGKATVLSKKRGGGTSGRKGKWCWRRENKRDSRKRRKGEQKRIRINDMYLGCRKEDFAYPDAC